MSRYRLEPSPQQEPVLLRHCADARYAWNLCVEQESHWRRYRGRMPGYTERCRQLSEARAENPWLAEGSVMVQQQAIRDHGRAMANFFGGTHRRPSWRKKGVHEGFRIVNFRPEHVRRLNRKNGEVFIPKIGWVRFRWSRRVPAAKSFRVKRTPDGRWWVSFAVIPEPIDGPGRGEVVGIDRGVAVSAALSSGEMHSAPKIGSSVERLQKKLSRQEKGSNRRKDTRTQLARAHAHAANRRRDWAEKLSTDIARRFDVIRVEDLQIRSMVKSARGTMEAPGKNVAQKSGLNREISRSGWGILVERLEQKAPGRVEKVPPAYTSQCCSECGHTCRENRESQALFLCVACGYSANADVNAARNIAAGHAVRGETELSVSVKRQPLAA